MSVPARSFGTVLEDVLGNFQAIIRAEIRLARAEFRQELDPVRAAAAMLGVGALAALFAVLFALLAVFFALAQKVPDWAAALIVALPLAIGAWAALGAGRGRIKRIGTPSTTVEHRKE